MRYACRIHIAAQGFKFLGVLLSWWNKSHPHKLNCFFFSVVKKKNDRHQKDEENWCIFTFRLLYMTFIWKVESSRASLTLSNFSLHKSQLEMSFYTQFILPTKSLWVNEALLCNILWISFVCLMIFVVNVLSFVCVQT